MARSSLAPSRSPSPIPAAGFCRSAKASPATGLFCLYGIGLISIACP
ncbi:hypothetical protein APV28_4337 [Comamonas testosteroni]|nr:hypothetical protein APV28_4337 [Comamonas testosteroni]